MNKGQDTSVLQNIAATLRDAGLARGPLATDRIDYIGVALDYMREIARREAESWESGAREVAIQSVKLQHAFVAEHLGWVSAFVDKALEQVGTDFYRGHLLMLKRFISQDRERLQALLEEVAPGPSAELS
jgi:TorA maturation chaperone TorD